MQGESLLNWLAGFSTSRDLRRPGTVLSYKVPTPRSVSNALAILTSANWHNNSSNWRSEFTVVSNTLADSPRYLDLRKKSTGRNRNRRVFAASDFLLFLFDCDANLERTGLPEWCPVYPFTPIAQLPWADQRLQWIQLVRSFLSFGLLSDFGKCWGKKVAWWCRRHIKPKDHVQAPEDDEKLKRQALFNRDPPEASSGTTFTD